MYDKLQKWTPGAFESVDRLLIVHNFPVSCCYLAVWNRLRLESKGEHMLLKAFSMNSFKGRHKQKSPSRDVDEAPGGDVSESKRSRGGGVAATCPSHTTCTKLNPKVKFCSLSPVSLYCDWVFLPSLRRHSYSSIPCLENGVTLK